MEMSQQTAIFALKSISHEPTVHSSVPQSPCPPAGERRGMRRIYPPPVYRNLTSLRLVHPALFAEKTGGRHQTLRATHPRMLAREAFCHGLQQNPNHQLYEKKQEFQTESTFCRGSSAERLHFIPIILTFPYRFVCTTETRERSSPLLQGYGAPHGDWKGAGGSHVCA